MLDHLEKCDGIEDYKVICCVEPVNNIIPNLIESHPLNTELVVNNRLLGVWANKKKALSLGFDESDYVIHVEDDILLSKDSLSLFEFGYSLGEDPSIFSMTAFGPRSLDKWGLNPEDFPDTKHAHRVNKHQWYHPWGWATWEDRWLDFKDKWNGHDQELNHTIRGDRFEVFPTLSRVNSIGDRRGEYINAICDDEIFKVIKNNPKMMSAYKCESDQEIRNVITEYKLKLDDGVEIIKTDDSRAGTKHKKSFKPNTVWAGHYDIPKGNFELNQEPQTVLKRDKPWTP
jgi:hypothetical protein